MKKKPGNLTLKVLQDIRAEQRATRLEIQSTHTDLREEFHQTNVRLVEMNERFDTRFETIETALRDIAGQLVMLAPGIEQLEKPAH